MHWITVQQKANLNSRLTSRRMDSFAKGDLQGCVGTYILSCKITPNVAPFSFAFVLPKLFKRVPEINQCFQQGNTLEELREYKSEAEWSYVWSDLEREIYVSRSARLRSDAELREECSPAGWQSSALESRASEPALPGLQGSARHSSTRRLRDAAGHCRAFPSPGL